MESAKKIRNWADLIMIVGLTVSTIVCLVMFSRGSDKAVYALYGIIILVLGWTLTLFQKWLCYGFADLIDNSYSIAKKLGAIEEVKPEVKEEKAE